MTPLGAGHRTQGTPDAAPGRARTPLRAGWTRAQQIPGAHGVDALPADPVSSVLCPVSSGLTIERIFLSPGHNFFGHFGGPAGTHPVVEVDAVECVAGRGLRGDRFFDYQPDYKGQVTLFSAEVFAQLCRDLGLAGASPADLNALRGQEFELQGVRLLGGEECKPCSWMDQALGPGAEAWLRGRGGLRCRILSDGWLSTGPNPFDLTGGDGGQGDRVLRSHPHSVPFVTFCKNVPGSGRFIGAILAGGESRRMGTDKALLEFDGLPLWRRQQRVLGEAGMAEIVLVRRPGQSDLAAGIPLCRDRFPGAGPIAGLHAALTFNLAGPAPAGGELVEPADGVAVLAVDMPAIDARWFTWLRRHCRPGGGAVARHAGRFEPLAAIYPAAARPLVEERIRQGRNSLQGLVAELVAAGLMTVVLLPEDERHRVVNWNTPADRGS
jgi:molybdopterin-guanine dinucleotide biosynthesis protein A